MSDVAHALQAGYHLSTFFAWFLSVVGFMVLLQQFGRICLGDLARHNHIEHNASLVHKDAEFEAVYAPCDVDDNLLEAFCSDVKELGTKEARMNAEGVARARIRRENESAEPLDGLHAELARGEMAIALGVFGGRNGARDGVLMKWLKEWFKHERLPRGWKPTHTQGIFLSIKMSMDIRNAMNRLAAEEDVADDEMGMALSDSASSSGDSLFISGEVSETTPPTSDSEDGTPVKKKPSANGER
jgi:hypothetical protein